MLYEKIMYEKDLLEGIPYSTEAPTEDNDNGKLKFVVLDQEPEHRYRGYFYIITEA